MSGRALLLGLTIACALANASPATAAQVPCADLARLSLPEATVTAAEEVPAGEYAPPAGPRLGNLPAFCRVALSVLPQIRIEVWLPATRRRQDGTVVARPLCAYPATARWTGKASPDDAANFVCVDGQHQSGDFRVADPPRN